MYVSRPFKKVRSVNSTSSAFPSLVAEIDLDKSLPYVNGILDAGTAAGRTIIPMAIEPGGNGRVPYKMELWPYAISADEDTFTMRVIGWRRFLPIASTEPRTLWLPGILGDFTCTLGTFTGLAGFPVLNTELFVDTITQTTAQEPSKMGNTTLFDGFTKRFTPANNTPARCQVLLEGCEMVEVQWDQTLNTPAMNALYTFIDCVD